MSARAVLFFLCLNDSGGAELSMLKLARALAARGRSVTLAVYGAHTDLAHASGFGGEVIDLNARRTLGAILPLVRLLRARSFSALVSALTATNVAAQLAVFLSGRALSTILTEHGLDDLLRGQENPWRARLLRAAYARAGRVVAVSEGLAQGWRALLRDVPVATIFNPVFDEDMPVTPVADALLPPGQGKLIMAAGRLRPEKDFATLIEAFVQLSELSPPPRLVLLGEGPERAALEGLVRVRGVAERVQMPGFQGDLPAWLVRADLFVCSSRREGFGNVLVEALAQGVPVVSTDCPFGPREILREGTLGPLVPVADSAALAAAIRMRLAAPPDLAKLKARARDFSTAHCLDGYLALIDTLSDQGGL